MQPAQRRRCAGAARAHVRPHVRPREQQSARRDERVIAQAASEPPAQRPPGWGPPLPTSAPGPGPPLPTSASGPGSPLPHLHRDRTRRCHICIGTGLAPATSAPGLGSAPPHLHRDLPAPSPTCSARRCRRRSRSSALVAPCAGAAEGRAAPAAPNGAERRNSTGPVRPTGSARAALRRRARCGGSDLQVDHVVLQRVAPRGVGDGLAVAVVAVLRDVHLVLADAVEGQ
jgi:hypothetical protein